VLVVVVLAAGAVPATTTAIASQRRKKSLLGAEYSVFLACLRNNYWYDWTSLAVVLGLLRAGLGVVKMPSWSNVHRPVLKSYFV
jgi:hypothetical protein